MIGPEEIAQAADQPSQASDPELQAGSSDEEGKTTEGPAVARDHPPSSDLPAAVVGTIDAVQRGNASHLRDLAEVVAVGCTHADGAGGPPKCAEGDAEGTGYEVFPYGACQVGWVPSSGLKDFFDELLPLTGELRAVVWLGRGAGDDPHTRGDTLIVFEPADSRRVTQAVGLVLAGGRFVRAERGCRTVDQMLRNPDGSSRELLHSPSRE